MVEVEGAFTAEVVVAASMEAAASAADLTVAAMVVAPGVDLTADTTVAGSQAAITAEGPTEVIPEARVLSADAVAMERREERERWDAPVRREAGSRTVTMVPVMRLQAFIRFDQAVAVGLERAWKEDLPAPRGLRDPRTLA